MTGASFTTQTGRAVAFAEGSTVGVYATGANEDDALATARGLVRFIEAHPPIIGHHDSALAARREVVEGRQRRAIWRRS